MGRAWASRRRQRTVMLLPLALATPLKWAGIVLCTCSLWFWSWLIQEVILGKALKSGGNPTTNPLPFLVIHFVTRTTIICLALGMIALFLLQYRVISAGTAMSAPVLLALLNYVLIVLTSQVPSLRGFANVVLRNEQGITLSIKTINLDSEACLHTIRLPGGGRFHIFHAGESYHSLKVLSMTTNAIEIAVCTSPRLAARSCPPPLWARCFASRIRLTERSGGRVDWEILEEEPRTSFLDPNLLDRFVPDPGFSRVKGHNLFVYPKAEAVA